MDLSMDKGQEEVVRALNPKTCRAMMTGTNQEETWGARIYSGQ